jgi:ferritin-like metal-binding protein YciE/osmotically-inducible protein OsmY
MNYREHDRRQSRRGNWNAEENLRRGTVFDRSARPRGNFDMPPGREQMPRRYQRLRAGESSWRGGEAGGDRDEAFEYANYGTYYGPDFDIDFEQPTTGMYEREWWRVPGPYEGMGPHNYRRSEERICEEVCQRLTYHGQIDASQIEVDVAGDIVILTGTVDSHHAKRMVEDMALMVPGVSDVRNRLRVEDDYGQERRRNRFSEMEGRWHEAGGEQIRNLEDLFFLELRDLYDAEHQLMKTLPKFAEAAHSDALKRGFDEHREQTRRQIERLEQIFDEHGRTASRLHCEGMEGILEEGEKLLYEHDAEPDVLDAALILAAQKAEHYEIATYGTVRSYAQQLGFDKAARLLEQTLDEESKTNERLTSMAMGHINVEAK